MLRRNLGIALVTALLSPASFAWAEDAVADESLPAHLSDRGAGLPTSRFGTYVREGEWLVELAGEYLKNQGFEYDPNELGFGVPIGSFKGRYEATRGLVFVAYGLSDRFAVELEANGIDASLRKAADDPSSMPEKLTESGLGQVRSRLDWRWLPERGRRPELFSYAEVVFPHDKEKALIGTADWVINGGLGAIRGFRWGTMTVRLGFEYDTSSASAVDFHEYAIEYLKRLSPKVSVYLGYVVFEGDEASLATELHWSPNPRVMIRLGNRLGVVSSTLSATPNGLDWAPTIGVVLRSFRR
jgi:hypothetical protein